MALAHKTRADQAHTNCAQIAPSPAPSTRFGPADRIQITMPTRISVPVFYILKHSFYKSSKRVKQGMNPSKGSDQARR
jgi:hypothetical protein